ncbi:11416_t:CDS:2, partial [Scutellospora calospora]
GIDEVMKELGINKFVAVITDNVPNMKATWYILKLNWPKGILETSKKIVNYFRNHSIPLAALRHLQIEKYSHIISLIQIVDTHWGSAFY